MFAVQAVSADGGYSYAARWGSSGTGQGYFYGIQGIAVDTAGDVYTVEADNHRVQKFTPDGKFVATWGHEGKEDGLFRSPFGVAVDSAGDIYVADTWHDQVQKLSSSGTFMTKWGKLGSEDGQFSYAEGICVDRTGDVYVVDRGNNRIQKFSSSGEFLLKWGYPGEKDGEFANPQAVAVSNDGDVYVVDRDNSRIQQFTSDGTFVRKWGYSGADDGQFRDLHGIAVDSTGHVYVADTGNHRVQKFTPEGVFVTAFGKEDDIDIRWVAVDTPGNVYVAASDKIVKYVPGGSGSGSSGTATKTGTTTRATTVGPAATGPGEGGGGSPDSGLLLLAGAGIMLVGGVALVVRRRKPDPLQKPKKSLLGRGAKARDLQKGAVQKRPGVAEHDAMISYASPDKAVADAVRAGLEARGFRCWIAPRDILPGKDYKEQIVDAIGKSVVFVLIYSSHSNSSPHVNREGDVALSRGVPIIPFRIENVLPPAHMQYLIGTGQWLDAFAPPLDGHVDVLAETVRQYREEQQPKEGSS